MFLTIRPLFMKKLNLTLLFLFALTLMSFAQLTKKEWRLHHKNWHRQFPKYSNFMKSRTEYRRVLNMSYDEYWKEDRLVTGHLKTDIDSIYVIFENKNTDSIKSPIYQGKLRCLNGIALSNKKFNYETKSFENVDNSQITRILISYYDSSKCIPTLFEKTLPFAPADFPNLQELIFCYGFPDPASLTEFKTIRSIHYCGYPDEMGFKLQTAHKFFRIPQELTELKNLTRLVIENAAVEYPDYVKNFSNLKMLVIPDNLLPLSDISVLAIPSLEYFMYIYDDCLNCGGNMLLVYFDANIKYVYDTDADDWILSGFYPNPTEQCVSFMDIENILMNWGDYRIESKQIGDTIFHLYYYGLIGTSPFIKGMTIRGVPKGIWVIGDGTYDFSNGFSVSKLDKHYIETDGFIFYMDKYCRQCYDLYDAKGRLLAAYDNGKFWGEMSYKDTLDEFIQKFDFEN